MGGGGTGVGTGGTGVGCCSTVGGTADDVEVAVAGRGTSDPALTGVAAGAPVGILVGMVSAPAVGAPVDGIATISIVAVGIDTDGVEEVCDGGWGGNGWVAGGIGLGGAGGGVITTTEVAIVGGCDVEDVGVAGRAVGDGD